MKVTLETVIGDIIDFDPDTAEIFLECGMHCFGCPVSRMENVEEKLGLVAKLMKSRQAIEEIDEKIDELAARAEDAETVKKLEEIKTIINKLEE